jgi:uncharacterized protein YbaR (Trm112 family)
MPNENQSQLKLEASLLARLACPVCHSDLRLGEKNVVCANCGRAYPIIDGIPVLIAERAIIPSP